MIHYSLRCDQGHDFDGWFRSSDAFETMRDSARLSCAQCGSTSVEKTLMSPSVAAKTARPLSAPVNPAQAALDRLRRHVEKNSDYVGLKFADEARAMHEGRSPGRAIHGEARPDEAKKLIEDGVPIAPLPFLPRQKSN